MLCGEETGEVMVLDSEKWLDLLKYGESREGVDEVM